MTGLSYTRYPESFDKGYIPKDWTDSLLRPIPKPEKYHHKLNGYRILSKSNTVGKLMEHIVARKLASDLEDREVLPTNQGIRRLFRPGKWTWENGAAFACDVYKGFQRKEQTVAVVISLKDAYNKVQFKLLMNLLIVFSIESA